MFLECKRLVGDAVELFGDGNQNHYKYIRDRVTRVDNLPHRLNYTSENHYVNVVGGDNKLSQRDECIKEFKKVFPHIKLEETEIPIEGGEVVVDDTRKVILITPSQNVHRAGLRYLDYPMKDGSSQTISEEDVFKKLQNIPHNSQYQVIAFGRCSTLLSRSASKTYQHTYHLDCYCNVLYVKGKTKLVVDRTRFCTEDFDKLKGVYGEDIILLSEEEVNALCPNYIQPFKEAILVPSPGTPDSFIEKIRRLWVRCYCSLCASWIF